MGKHIKLDSLLQEIKYVPTFKRKMGLQK